MPPRNQFAKFITEKRQARGLSKMALAKEVGVARANVTFWERGDSLPLAATLERLARALRVSYEDLFVLAGYIPPKELPGTETYLRALYPKITEEGLAEAEQLFIEFDDRFRSTKKANHQKGRRR